MKKVIAVLFAVSIVLSAETKDKGLFVGLDYTGVKTTLNYYASGATAYNNYDNSLSDNSVGFKAGYQYYWTRVYFRYHTFSYHDDKRNKFSIKGDAYEFNAEYLPTFYKNSSKSFKLHGLIGAMAGYTKTKLENGFDTNILPAGENSEQQNKFLYGFQAGLLLESEYGVSVEAGWRYREGNILEYVDENDNSVVFTQKSGV